MLFNNYHARRTLKMSPDVKRHPKISKQKSLSCEREDVKSSPEVDETMSSADELEHEYAMTSCTSVS